MVFLKLVHIESQVNRKTQLFWVKVVHLIPNVQTLAGHVIHTIHLAPTTTLHLDTVNTKNQVFIPALDFFFAKLRLSPNN